MSGRKLSREEVQRRRQALREECKDYAPTRGGHQCQQYAGDGACKRPDYFMCVVWAKRNPEQMYHLQQQDKPKPKAEPSAEEEAKREAALRRASRYSTTAELMPPFKGAEAELIPPPTGAQVYDLASHGVRKQDDGRHLLEKPELLTEEAIEALCKLGIEVTVKTSRGMEVTLVPKLTDADRCELTFAHARTLVMVLQVFPRATVEQIVKPKQEAG